ncbi:putative membrane protein, partial [Vibrio parahaemolyticus AQ3810]
MFIRGQMRMRKAFL